MSLFLAVVVSIFGVVGAFLVTVMTCFLWGSIFAMEVLLFHNGSASAKEWFVTRYDFKTFKIEYKVFYPLMGFCMSCLKLYLISFLKRS